MPISHVPIFSGDNFSLVVDSLRRFRIFWLMVAMSVLVTIPTVVFPEQSDFPTHHSEHEDDAQVDTLPMDHVHGLRINKDQQLGPVPLKTPWPIIPSQLAGKELDDWLKARFRVSKNGAATVVKLQPAAHHELTQEGLLALEQWTFFP